MPPYSGNFLYLAYRQIIDEVFGPKMFSPKDFDWSLYLQSAEADERYPLRSLVEALVREDYEQSDLGYTERALLHFLATSTEGVLPVSFLVGEIGTGKSTTSHYSMSGRASNLTPDVYRFRFKPMFFLVPFDQYVSSQSMELGSGLLEFMARRLDARLASELSKAEESTTFWDWAERQLRDPEAPSSVVCFARLAHTLAVNLELYETTEGETLGESQIKELRLKLIEQLHGEKDATAMSRFQYAILRMEYLAQRPAGGSVLVLIDGLDNCGGVEQSTAIDYILSVAHSSRCRFVLAMRPPTFVANRQFGAFVADVNIHYGPGVAKALRHRLEKRFLDLTDEQVVSEYQSVMWGVVSETREYAAQIPDRNMMIPLKWLRVALEVVKAKLLPEDAGPPALTVRHGDPQDFESGKSDLNAARALVELANYSIRVAQQLVHNAVSSPDVPFDKWLGVEIHSRRARPGYSESEPTDSLPAVRSVEEARNSVKGGRELIRGMILGRSKVFLPSPRSAIVNVFLSGDAGSSISLAKLRILGYLLAHSELAVPFVPAKRCMVWCNELFGYTEAALCMAVNSLQGQLSRLITNDRVLRIEPGSPEALHCQIASSRSGKYYYKHLSLSFDYLDLMTQSCLREDRISDIMPRLRSVRELAQLIVDADIREINRIVDRGSAAVRSYRSYLGEETFSSSFARSVRSQVSGLLAYLAKNPALVDNAMSELTLWSNLEDTARESAAQFLSYS